MKRPVLHNLSKERYKEYLRMLPDLSKQKNKDYTMLVLSLFAATFFGVFAIQPTFSTITKLQRQLEDSKFVNISLQTKISNLSTLMSLKTQIEPDIPSIFAVIPTNPNAGLLTAQLQAVAQQNGLTIQDIQIGTAPLFTLTPINQEDTQVEFSITVSGSDSSFVQFINDLTSFNRILTVSAIAYDASTLQEEKALVVKGTAYFMPFEK